MEEVKGIFLQSGLDYFTNSEYVELQKRFKEQGMVLLATKGYSPKAAIGDLIIYINQHMTELIVSGLFTPAAYDVLKLGVCSALRKIKENFKMLQGGKLRNAEPCIKYHLHNMEIIAPIPSNLSNKQFNKYFDSINELIKEVNSSYPIEKEESLIIESNGSKLELKTIYEYTQEKKAQNSN